MPITQDRMIALIEVAIAYEQIIDELHNAIDDALARKRADMDAKAEIEALKRVTAELRPTRTQVRIVVTEQSHFESMSLHNDRAKRYAENKRREAGISRRWPSEEQQRHRVEHHMAERATETTTEHIERLVREVERREAQEAIDKAQAEVDAKAAAEAAAKASEPSRESYAKYDQEALDAEEVWKNDPGSIVGS